jgi:tetratricopeptide (TPR) repeat protein
MKTNGQMSAVLLVAALSVVGCSKRDDTKKTTASEPTEPAVSQPLPAPDPSLLARTDDEGFSEPVKPARTGPVSFAAAEAAYHAKDYGNAAAMFEEYTGERPDNAWGHFMLGLSAWKIGDPVKAEGAFKAALAIDPDHVKSLVNLSRVQLEQKKVDEALDTLMTAGDIEPNSVDVQRLLGRAFHAQGKTDEAIDAYRRAIALDEKDAWSMNNLGLLLLEQRKAEEALPLLTKAVELKKDVPAFHNNLGMALEHTGRFGAAALAYKGAVAADPGYEKAKANLARVEAVKHDREEPFTLAATEEAAGAAETVDEAKTGDAAQAGR